MMSKQIGQKEQPLCFICLFIIKRYICGCVRKKMKVDGRYYGNKSKAQGIVSGETVDGKAAGKYG